MNEQTRRYALHGTIWWAVLVVALASIVATSFAVSPDDLESGRLVLSPPCPSKVLLHRPCPTCGMTRGFAALGHGRWHDALQYNRASPVAFAGCFAAFLFGAAGLVRSIHAYRRVSSRRRA